LGQPFPFRKHDNVKDEEKDGAKSPNEEKKPKLSTKMQQQLQRAFNWVKTYEDKLLQMLEPESVDIKKLGGKPLEEGVEEELNKFVVQEDESKWRCKVPDCTKLFKASHFWRKHVEKRHNEFFERIKNDIVLVNTYVMDPAHIAPSRSDANSNGHFPLSGHGQTGTPRGFNLGNLQQFNGAMPNVPPGMPPPVHIAQLLAQAGMNPQWAAPTYGGAEDDRHGAGPHRRNQTNRYNNRGPGPYDRPNKDNRNQRWGNGSGRLTPPRNKPTGNPRFADGAGAGPREAVQGRSLKSYEDLDAAGGGGTDALDY